MFSLCIWTPLDKIPRVCTGRLERTHIERNALALSFKVYSMTRTNIGVVLNGLVATNSAEHRGIPDSFDLLTQKRAAAKFEHVIWR